MDLGPPGPTVRHDEQAEQHERDGVRQDVPEPEVQERCPQHPVEAGELAGLDAAALQPIVEQHGVDGLDHPQQHGDADDHADTADEAVDQTRGGTRRRGAHRLDDRAVRSRLECTPWLLVALGA